MKALVLPGGSIKGAFQAGVIEEVLNRGYKPDAIYGVSVGALNGAFLTDAAARLNVDTNPEYWKIAGQELRQFWIDNVTSFKDIGKKNGFVKLAWKIIRNKFDSVLTLNKLEKLLRDTLNEPRMHSAPVLFKTGAVNFLTTEFKDFTNRNPNIDLIAGTLASTRIPIAMPVQYINGNPYYDGGIRDVAPIGSAIKDGATEIVVIPCHPEKLGVKHVKRGSLFAMISRVIDIMVNEILTNDLEQVDDRNLIAQNAPNHPKYRYVPTTVIRPLHTLAIDLEKFDKNDIIYHTELGITVAKATLGNKRWD